MRQKLAEFFDLLMGFRKFIAFLLLFMISIVFRLKNDIDGAQFVDLLKAVAVSFFATNGLEHFTSMVKDYAMSKSGQTQETPPENKQEGQGT